MARNRRESTSLTSAVGQGCFLLLVGAVCVVFSVTKIIVGSEFVNHCPSREMIPVYVIVSGCLPVLLSALRQPYDGGHAMDKERCSAKISVIIAVAGVMVNLAWLVAGTYLVVTTWTGDICKSPIPSNVINTTIPENLTSPTSEQLTNQKPMQNKSAETLADINNLDLSAADTSNTGNKTSIDHSKPGKITTTDKFGKSKHTTVLYTVGESVTDKPNNKDNLGNNETEDNGERTPHLSEVRGGDKGGELDSINSKGVTEIFAESTKSTDNTQNKFSHLTESNERIEAVLADVRDGATKKTSRNSQCVTCDIHILKFSLAVIIIDWIFVTLGIAYFCHFVYYRFSSLKDQILLIHA